MARQSHRQKVEVALAAAFERHGFRNRTGEVWTREGGVVQAWAALEIAPVWRSDDLQADALVGARVDSVERLFGQIRNVRPRRQTPTFVRHLAALHPDGTTGIRTAGARWLFKSGERPERHAADFADAFTASALPFLERIATLDGLAAEMAAGRIDGEVGWRLPLVHLLRADSVAAREALEHGTRWAANGYDEDAYRDFAIEVVRRLGDATLVETPSEELVSVLRPALRAAFPDRAGPILAALVRSFWWERHPESVDARHCSFCGATDVEARLFGIPRCICDTCVAACRVMFEDPLATGVSRYVTSTITSGPRRGQQEIVAAPGPRGVSAEGFAADAVRALRGSLDEPERYIAPVERRLLRAPADRDPATVCVACGPIRVPRRIGWEWNCSFCGGYIRNEPTVDCGRATICEGCVAEMFEEVDEDRRLA